MFNFVSVVSGSDRCDRFSPPERQGGRGGERERGRQRDIERGEGFTLAPHFCPINRLPVCCVFCMTKEGNIKLPFVMKMHFAN